jgi:eukaryotic-like serine/threonine-protein kinase
MVCPEHQVALVGSVAPAIPPPSGVSMPGGMLDGRYRLMAKLGSGGVGTVYKAMHLWLHRVVAIKFLRREMTSSDEAVRRFAREARLLIQAENPYCTAVYDFARTADGAFYLVMEYVDGYDFRELLNQQYRLTLLQAAPLFEQLLSALDAAHRVGIVHRDIKPENILLQPQPDGSLCVKLFDFGMARHTENARTIMALTAPGQTLGTPHYMAPEQAMGMPLDGRADLYAVGCLLFETLTGQRLFEADGSFELMTAHVNDPPRKAREVAPDAGLPLAIDIVLQRVLAKDPNARFPDASSFSQALLLATRGRG